MLKNSLYSKIDKKIDEKIVNIDKIKISQEYEIILLR